MNPLSNVKVLQGRYTHDSVCSNMNCVMKSKNYLEILFRFPYLMSLLT